MEIYQRSSPLSLVYIVATGFKKLQHPLLRTVAMTIHYSKVFDTLNHTKLLGAPCVTFHFQKRTFQVVRPPADNLRQHRAVMLCGFVSPKVQLSPQTFSTYLYPTNPRTLSSRWNADEVHAAQSATNSHDTTRTLIAHVEAVREFGSQVRRSNTS